MSCPSIPRRSARRLAGAVLPLLMLLLACAALPAWAHDLSGLVTDEAGAPVADAQVTVVEVGRSTLTDAAGRYRVANLPDGVYRVSLQRIGYAPAVRNVTVGRSDIVLDFRLGTSLVEIPAVQVTASATATTALTSPQPVSVLSDEALRLAKEPSLGATLSGLAGLRNWSTGSGIGKPVIRGLRNDRVLVLADGQRLENQTWGDEHGPNLDLENVDRVEVIRGPASVLYGSDALGGVVNVIPPDLPTAYDRPALVRGTLGSTFQSNSSSLLGHFGLEAATGGLGFRGSLSGHLAQDQRTPEGKLSNSGGSDGSGAAEVGARGRWGTLAGSYSHRRERIEIHEDPAEDPAATPYQEIRDDLGRVKAMFPVAGGSHLDLVGSYEVNDRREFEAATDPDYALGLEARTWIGDARFHHAPIGAFHGLVGVNYTTTGFDKSGEETLIPDSDTWNVAGYLFEQVDLDPVHLSFGVRYDRRELSVEDDADLGVSAQDRSWDAVTGNAGVLLELGRTSALALNLGRGFRAPSTFDLFSNGVHEGTVAYEVGDPNLDTETSLNADLAFRVQSSRLRAEVGGFINDISDFIYSRPTGTFDPESGFQVYQVTQGDARLTGAELSGEWHPSSLLHFHLSADYVRGDNTETDTPLPWIPPFRAIYGMRLEGEALGALEHPYLSVAGESNAAQDRLDPLDTATGAYTLLHLGAGFAAPNGGLPLQVDLQLRNALDTTYTDFMSRYKAYALSPGRNFIVRVTAKF